MRKIIPFLALLFLLSIPLDLDAKTKRSTKARADFMKLTPCPSTGKTKGACPGYVIDHIFPICAGGLDDPTNMAWSGISEAGQKDKEEVRLCRMINLRQIQAGNDKDDLCLELEPLQWPLLTKSLCVDRKHEDGNNQH